MLKKGVTRNLVTQKVNIRIPLKNTVLTIPRSCRSVQYLPVNDVFSGFGRPGTSGMSPNMFGHNQTLPRHCLLLPPTTVPPAAVHSHMPPLLPHPRCLPKARSPPVSARPVPLANARHRTLTRNPPNEHAAPAPCNAFS